MLINLLGKHKSLIIRLFWTLLVNLITILCIAAMYAFPEQLNFLGNQAYFSRISGAPWSLVICLLPVFILPFIWFGEIIREGSVTLWSRRIMLVLMVLLQTVICVVYMVWFFQRFHM